MSYKLVNKGASILLIIIKENVLAVMALIHNLLFHKRGSRAAAH